MTDILDRASELELLEREAQIERARASRPSAGLPFKGWCYFCQEPVAAPEAFCDGDCAADHERERAAKLRNTGRG